MLKISNLTKTFGKKTILDNVSLQLNNPDHLHVLTGESGSGKTTLFNIIFGLDNDYEGTYELFGVDSKTYKNQNWDRLRTDHIKMVFQDFKLFDQLTVYENLYLSGNFEDNEIYSILESMDLLSLKNEYVKNISGGQKQRVAIGRAVLGSPKIILLDEPTGNLDGMTTDKIMDYITKLKNKGILFFIITHDSSILEYADVLYQLEKGKINKTYQKNENEYTEHSLEPEKFKNIKTKKHIFTYTFLSMFRKKKRLFLLGVPIIIILISFILSFTAFQAASLDSFTNFFAGVDDKTIVFNTQTLSSELENELRNNNVLASNDGERLGFSNADINEIANIENIETFEAVVEGVQSHFDYEGNRFEYRLDYENVPAFLRKDLNQIRSGESITFSLKAQTVPSSVIRNYNLNDVDIILGEFPKDHSKEILIPDLYAFTLSETEDILDLVNTRIDLDVISDENNSNAEEYKIVGIYDTKYQHALSTSYPIYTGYIDQSDIQNKLSEDSYQFHKQSYKVNKATEEYTEPIAKDYEHFKQAMGTGYDQMIVVVDDVNNFDSVYKELKEIFPDYQFTSQYDLKNGDLSGIYHSLVRNLVVGSTIIAAIIGIVVVFLNKGYIYDRTKEFAVLFCQGFSKSDIVKMISLENGLIFFVYFFIAYLSAIVIDTLFISNSKYNYLFVNLLNLNNVLSLSLLVVIIVLFSIIWGIAGIRNKNLAKLLKG
ncbi:ATP-binding cassette domain-containing protein [Marinilactibacillus piezotolerans]|uniref:ATP-binding cassette domain-containing protein n=1 Tax=Marinilactibacillus piezotolerans TaxID=258723 RepID=UPI0015C4DC65|nr:ATP-binding cassette domain-containing protein [Marinilactibacillus piezotolerans]